MNASYKIALVAAVGLLILVAGYYATRGEEPAGAVAGPNAGQPLADNTPATQADEATRERPATPRDSSPPTDRNEPETPGEPTRPELADTAPTRTETPPAGSEDGPDTGAFVELGPPPGDANFPLRSPSGELLTRDRSEGTSTQPGREVRASPDPGETTVTTDRNPSADEPARGATAEPEADPEPAVETPTARPRTEREPGVPTVYVVQPGDMLVTIAERIYGTQAAWEAIAQANPSVDPTRLRVGQELRLPRRASVERPREEPAAPVPGQRGEYTVQPGDNLYRIAERFYDDAEKWDVIYNHNRDAIGPDPGRLQAGMKLVIPPAVGGAN